MSTIIVKDTAGLTAALKAAQSGDVIKLAPGTYSSFTISNLSYTGNGLTITSLDANNPAQLTGMNVKGSQGINFSDLEFVVKSATDYPFQVNGSKNISFDRLDVHGSLDGNVANDVGAMLIRSSTNVKVTNSEFQELRHGIAHLDNNGVTISDNYFHDIRTDGIRGGGSSNVRIEGNYFTDFHPADGDHADAVQFWTTNTKASVTDLTITGNVIVRGSGDPIQGIFFRDQVGDLPHLNVTITDNLIVGGLYNGIVISGGENVTVSGNVVAGLADQKSWISTGGATNVTLTNNVGTEYLLSSTNGLVQSGNKTITSPADGGKALQEQWLATHSPAVVQTLITSGKSADVVLNADNLTVAVLNDAADAALREIEATRIQSVKVTGTTGADRLTADGVHDMLMEAGAGNDLLTGGGIGHNTMVGGLGDDTYYVKSVYDQVVETVGGGADTVVAYVDVTLSDNVETLKMMTGASYGGGNALDNRIVGTTDDDEVRGWGGADLLQGMEGNDHILGGDGGDSLQGAAGNDTLQGEADNDKLWGHDGADSLAGGGGSDTLEGGVGQDSLSGGAGADQFFFREGDLSLTADRIFDFKTSEGDKISVSMIDANVNVAGDQKFAFIGTDAFHKVAGEARYEMSSAGQATVLFDTNGDGVADLKLLVGATSLQSSDFLL